MDDRIVPDREVVVVLRIAVQDVDDGAAEVVRGGDRQVQQIAGDKDAAPGRHRTRHATHHRVQVFDRQRVLDGRLRVGRQRAGDTACPSVRWLCVRTTS